MGALRLPKLIPIRLPRTHGEVPTTLSPPKARLPGDVFKAMTIPGKNRKVAFVDVPYAHEDVGCPSAFAKFNTIMHAPVEMTIRPGASWRLDFDGASRCEWHTYNANQVAFTSGIWAMMTQTFVPTERVNDGAYFGTEFRLPKGTWMNPTIAAPGTPTRGTSWSRRGARSGAASARPITAAAISKK